MPAERRSDLRPSETQLPERSSGVFHQRNTPSYKETSAIVWKQYIYSVNQKSLNKTVE